MKKRIAPFIAGSLITAVVMSSTTVFATVNQTIEAFLGRVSVVVNNQKVSEETLLYHDTTYVPIRVVSEILGKEVYYDSQTNTAYIDEQGTKRGEKTTEAEAHPSWSYSGETGPTHWGSLNPDYKLASEGKEQSPINIMTKDVLKSAKESGVEVHYLPTSFKIENNGHTIEAVPDTDDNYILVDGVKYTLAQFHFHAPSEHEIDGKQSDMEVHFVNKTADGKIAVIGVLVKQGAENQIFKELFNNIPKDVTTEETMIALKSTIDISALLPKNSSVFRYDGSLTTPPATEGVEWTVYQNPIELSKEQISAFKAIYSDNDRPVQPLNEREVVMY